MLNQLSVLAFGHIPRFRGGRQQSGLANAMWALATHMKSAGEGVDVTFCATDIYTPTTTIDGLPVIGWTRTSLLLTIFKRPLRSLQTLMRVARSCSAHKQPFLRTCMKAFLLQSAVDQIAPSYIHLHGCESVVFLEAGIVEGAKTLLTIHGIFGTAGPPRQSAMEAALTRFPFKLLIFVSRDIASEWQATFGAPQAQIAIVPNSYDSQAFYRCSGEPRVIGGDKDAYRLVSVGSVCDRKGQQRVIDALARFCEVDPPFAIHYTMVGQSIPDSFARIALARAATAGLAVTYEPYLAPNDLRRLLWQSDYMILATSNEGFGLVFLESIASGTPVVLPRNLPICHEPDIISPKNAVLLECASTDAILTFLRELPKHRFVDTEVAASIPGFTWEAAGRRYRKLLRPQSNASPTGAV